MTDLPYFPLTYNSSGVGYSTLLTGIRAAYLTGFYVTASGTDVGLLYDLPQSSWTTLIDPAAGSTGNTQPYGPSFGSYATGLTIVGSFQVFGQSFVQGFVFSSAAPGGSQWTTVAYPGATNTILHSTFGNLAVGNWDTLGTANPDYETYPLAGNAFIYNLSTQTFTTNDKPGALSTTAYGIYDNLIAGGYDDTPAVNGIQPTHGYIYDMSTQTWYSYDHPGAIVTHFEGITAGSSPGAYTLIGDWLGASDPAGSPEHPFILQVQNFVPVSWTDFTIDGTAVASGNSVYGDTAIGVYNTGSGAITNGYVATIPCFASGTLIATPHGPVAVEHLRAGMLVLTEAGPAMPIKWLGRRVVACQHHPDPTAVWPVRVIAGAFDDHVPAHDLWLSPDHAVYADGVLIPIKHLMDGKMIAQVPCDEVTYWHVELPHHDVILAEGLPVESYLDTGGRSAFLNGGTVVVLHPNFAARVWEAEGCAPLVVTGATVAAVKGGLATRAIINQRQHPRRATKFPRATA
jgi:Hint domain